MTILKEIQEKVRRLSREEFFELVRWLRERHNDEWDQQIEEDVTAGRIAPGIGHRRGEWVRTVRGER